MSGKKKSRRRAQHLDLVVCPVRFMGCSDLCDGKCIHFEPHVRESSCLIDCGLLSKRPVSKCIPVKDLDDRKLSMLVSEAL